MPSPEPTLDDLHRVHELAIAQFPHDYLDEGLGAVGLFLHDSPRHAGYRQTPQNSITFASCGVDGVHMGSITDEAVVDPRAPVAATIPMDFEQPNHIVGASLHDFLCLGYHHGYAAIANLPSIAALDLFASPTGEPFDDRIPGILALLAAELRLEPWHDVHEHFHELQARFMPSLRVTV